MNIIDSVRACVRFATTLFARRQYQEALGVFGHAVAMDRTSVAAHVGSGRCHLALGHAQAAIDCLRVAAVLEPTRAGTHVDLGYAYHLAGRREEGWREFAWAYGHGSARMPRYSEPLWDGSALDGRRILLWTDQGHGDTIQFLRYVPYCRNRGGFPIVECHHPGLLPLITSVDGVAQVISKGTPRPDFDVHAPLMYFPSLFPDSLPATDDSAPYLAAPQHMVRRWRKRLGVRGGTRVGICWTGNREHPSAHSRFVPLQQFDRLLAMPGFTFFSIQHCLEPRDLLYAPERLRFEVPANEPFSIADAAALITTLDLVITVDTMVAHLAGALGKPVWVVLRASSNWRWGLRGRRTHWYHTMRLFRQHRAGDWNGVFDRVSRALRISWQDGPRRRSLSPNLASECESEIID